MSATRAPRPCRPAVPRSSPSPRSAELLAEIGARSRPGPDPGRSTDSMPPRSASRGPRRRIEVGKGRIEVEKGGSVALPRYSAVSGPEKPVRFRGSAADRNGARMPMMNEAGAFAFDRSIGLDVRSWFPLGARPGSAGRGGGGGARPGASGGGAARLRPERGGAGAAARSGARSRGVRKAATFASYLGTRGRRSAPRPRCPAARPAGTAPMSTAARRCALSGVRASTTAQSGRPAARVPGVVGL